jgi:hypothetical protein
VSDRIGHQAKRRLIPVADDADYSSDTAHDKSNQCAQESATAPEHDDAPSTCLELVRAVIDGDEPMPTCNGCVYAAGDEAVSGATSATGASRRSNQISRQ